MQQELSDLQPRFEQMSGEIETKKEAVFQLQAQRSSNMGHYKQMESKLYDLKNNLDECQEEYDSAMATDNDRIASAYVQFVPGESILIAKNMLLLKNPQFLPNYCETLSQKGTLVTLYAFNFYPLHFIRTRKF